MSQQMWCWRTTLHPSRVLREPSTISCPYTTTLWGLWSPTPQPCLLTSSPMLQKCHWTRLTAPGPTASCSMRMSKWECCLPPKLPYSWLPTPSLDHSQTGRIFIMSFLFLCGGWFKFLGELAGDHTRNKWRMNFWLLFIKRCEVKTTPNESKHVSARYVIAC